MQWLNKKGSFCSCLLSSTAKEVLQAYFLVQEKKEVLQAFMYISCKVLNSGNPY